MNPSRLLASGAEPYLFLGGKQACIIVHGFNSSTRENRDMGRFLADQGFTVLGVRLPGHATTPADLRRVRWTDWLAEIEDGYSLLKDNSEKIFIMGQSLGGVLTMTAASRYPFDGVIGISTPFGLLQGNLARFAHPWLIKGISLLVPEIKKPPLSDNPDEIDERAPGVDLDPYPRYVTRAFAEVLELVRQMQAGLAQISAPLLLIQGKHDSVVEKNAMQLFRERVASKRLDTLWLENTGHVVTLSNEREIAFRAIADFMRSISAD
jgi:carboxylesterase